MNNENAKKHEDKVLDDVLKGISPLDYEKTRNRMYIAAKIADFIDNVFGGKTKFAKEIGKYPSEITKWTSGTQNFTIDALTEITWNLGKKLHHIFEDEHPVQVTVYRVTKVITVKSSIEPIEIMEQDFRWINFYQSQSPQASC